jgi:hypothetical protein
MIGVVYAPKPAAAAGTSVLETQGGGKADAEGEGGVKGRRRDERPQGERKMNVVKGQSMFVRKEVRNENVGWGQWVWGVLGVDGKQASGANAGAGAAGGQASLSGGGGIGTVGGGQSNMVVRALKGLSETVFGF